MNHRGMDRCPPSFLFCLTTISTADIINCDISIDDISSIDRKDFAKMNENIALTEAVYYILLSLYTPQHGYGIMQRAEQLSCGRVRLAAGTLYGALNTLSEKGWITALKEEPGSRRKEYQLTDKGLQVLKNELERLQQLVANGIAVIGGIKK